VLGAVAFDEHKIVTLDSVGKTGVEGKQHVALLETTHDRRESPVLIGEVNQ